MPLIPNFARFLIGCFWVFLPLVLNAKTLRVAKNSKLNSIQTAIKDAHDFDTIIVSPGTYFEKNIIVDKQITLMGDHLPVLDGENKYEVVSIKSSNVILCGFKIQHSGNRVLEDIAGIKIYNSENIVISNNVLEDTFFGIYVQYGKNCIIKNNYIKSYGIEEQLSGNGIHCWKSDSLQIIANKITGHRDGIYFEFVTNSIIWRNISKKNIRYGLHFMFSNNDAYISNIFSENGAGVAVMFTRGVKMINNIFSDNWGDAAYGLLLKEISDSYINGNKFKKNTIGIYMEGVNKTQVQNNKFSGNGWAIRVQASCQDVSVNYNEFLGNTFDVGTNGFLVLNSFDSNYWDKYEGYDINRDKIGDLPYHPISLYSVIIEKYPPAIFLFRSIMVSLLDKTERIIPSITPENLKDNYPLMKEIGL